MKTLTVRLRKVSSRKLKRSRASAAFHDVARERLTRAPSANAQRAASCEATADLVGSVRGLPSDLSARKKHYLKAMAYGRQRHR
jgi:hypothetical protein